MCKKIIPSLPLPWGIKNSMHNAINAQNTGLTCVTGDEEVKWANVGMEYVYG